MSAKMLGRAIFHVNGADPDAVVIRREGRDRVPAEMPQPVVIDMFCYRGTGHNEGDEPMFTQPVM